MSSVDINGTTIGSTTNSTTAEQKLTGSKIILIISIRRRFIYFILRKVSYNCFICIFKAKKLLVTSSGAAAEVHEDCLGDYELTGQSSNNKPVYQLFKDVETKSGISGSIQKIPQDRYIHFNNVSNWMVSNNYISYIKFNINQLTINHLNEIKLE